VTAGRVTWRQRMSLRTRMVLIATSAFVLMLTLAGVFIVLTTRAALLDNTDEVGEVRAEQVAELARMDLLPDRIVAADDFEVAVQVLRGEEVVSATENAMDRGFFQLDAMPPGEDDVVTVAHLPVDDDGPFRVTALGTRTPRGDATVFVAVDAEDTDEVLGAVVRQGVIGLSLLLVALGIVIWFVVSRTVAPLEAIRRRAEMITGQRLDQRVPEPVAHDEIHRLARTLNDMLARLENSARRQDRFVADAAHELRTPLATMRARLETALVRSGAGTDRQLLLDELSETVRMSSLVDQLLLLARSDAGRQRAACGPVDLEDVVTDAVSSLWTRTVEVRVRDLEPLQVLGDSAALEQVCRNLLENAVRHARRTVEVSLTSESGAAVLVVDDDGPGIPEQVRGEVFQRFFRLEGARDRASGGAGLGLAIVAEIVRAHSGTVEAGESPAHGARLSVRLPLVASTYQPASGEPVLVD
jgi:signal transduction histidine kinase